MHAEIAHVDQSKRNKLKMNTYLPKTTTPTTIAYLISLRCKEFMFSPEISPDEASPEDRIRPRVKRHQLPMKRPVSDACLNRSRFPLKTFSELDLTVFSSRLFQILITRSEKK